MYHDADHRHRVLRHHPRELVRRRALLARHPGGPRRHRGRHRDRMGIDRVRRADGRHERRQRRAGVRQLRLLAAAARRSATCSPASSSSGIILVTAIPFGIYDLVEAMDNVESAAAAGDSYPTTRVLTADGVVSLVGCLMGNPFINAVYIGHPGWKSMGGRLGYSAATGPHGDRARVVRDHRAGVVADPRRRDLADPALHRHADRRAGVPGVAEERTRPRSCSRSRRISPRGAS